jgi:putative hydrolase of HD superfamily
MTTKHTNTSRAAFAYEVGRLRFVLRDFYMDGISSAANVAEHTYRVSMLAWLIAETEGVDVGEVLKLSLIHDLPEVRTLDHGILPSQYVREQDEQAAEDMLSGILPSGLKAWHEYEARESVASKIVKDADRLEVLIECKELAFRGMKYPAFWDEELSLYPNLMFTKTAKDMCQEIWDMHPMAWQESFYRHKINALQQRVSHKLKVA